MEKILMIYTTVAGAGFILTLVVGGLALPFDKPRKPQPKHLPAWVVANPLAIRLIAAITALSGLGYLIGSETIKLVSIFVVCFTGGLFLAWVAVNIFRHGYFPDIGAKIGVERFERPVRYWTTLSLYSFGSLMLFGYGAKFAIRI